ncbi:conserved hypothetical protein [Histoplasma capsulatum G186AR]|uniref:Fungal-type protein kinase domain-containing protein n=2 Tax=Ajellomyces capsulatus TaxID=5037 RepID=C0NLX3_AJECG|nr:uncharacterized protein HCBG_04503 [Histoplasma capsulatum G186AR]EEH07624.1 conserved hypothetical protein [Histoplasma capsulatum G186AR]KAG5304234.1 hypothetical protein I7I52_02496 [Histoplasma capsulatum]QSS69832.1 hypothetical protein I7I50_11258 [Histoplasma capsulatum G186AR]
MSELSSDEIASIEKYPLRTLDQLRNFLQGTEPSNSLSNDGAADDPVRTDRMTISKVLITLMDEKASYNLQSPISKLNIASELASVFKSFQQDDFNYSYCQPLIQLIIQKAPDTDIWKAIFDLITSVAQAAQATRSTPPPRSSLIIPQTPHSRNTSSLANSSELRRDIDPVLRDELLGELHVNIPGFFAAYFDGIEGLSRTAQAVYQKCNTGDSPLYNDKSGWKDWPDDMDEKYVLDWLIKVINQLSQFAEDHDLTRTPARRPLAQPAQPIAGSIAKRKLDVGFVDNPDSTPDKKYKWSEILVPGELKNDRKYDIPSGARLDLARYAREVLSAQDDRRFVLGFTLCGPILRVWEFDRCGGIASDAIDINKDGLRFISVMLGFLYMDRSQLGFDPTVVTVNGRRCIEIECGGEKECLVIDEVILRARCIAGRATTCWRAHRKAGDLQMPLVIKDSWQYSERDEEGELLRQATECGVTNVARYDSHVTVQVDGKDDDIQAIRKGLSVPTVNNQSNSLQELPKRSASNRGRNDPGNSAIGQKRSSDCMDPVFPPPSKRTQSNSPTKVSAKDKPLNRVHRRVIVQDYGIPIFKSSSKVALLKGIELCIEGYESLYSKTGLIQSDISPQNLLINEDKDNPSWRAFLIDLDLAIREQRDGYSGARGKTGTRAFMAIGVLYGEKHSFMHDLESFFWVLFWICVHYEGPGRGREVGDFEEWNYMSTEKLAGSKKGVIDDEGDFLRTATDNFTPYYQPLVSWVNRLRRIVFPGGRRWKKPNPNLGLDMRRVIQEAQKDPDVIG